LIQLPWVFPPDVFKGDFGKAPEVQIPISKSQISNNIQAPITKRFWNSGPWDLVHYLGMGAWDLVLHE
jgi:hypothetical protein